jgi:hypothetical protein
MKHFVKEAVRRFKVLLARRSIISNKILILKKNQWQP